MNSLTTEIEFFPSLNNLPISSLSIKHVFFEDFQPIFFVCKDNRNNLYACVLCDDRNGRKWIVSPTNRFLLRKMVFNKITLHDLFANSRTLGNSYVYIQRNEQWMGAETPSDKIASEDLPTVGEFFDADINEVQEYFNAFNHDLGESDTLTFQRNAVDYEHARILDQHFLLDKQKTFWISKQQRRLRKGVVA